MHRLMTIISDEIRASIMKDPKKFDISIKIEESLWAKDCAQLEMDCERLGLKINFIPIDRAGRYTITVDWSEDKIPIRKRRSNRSA